MKYKLAAFDADNTLLDSRKELSPRIIEDIGRAVREGCEVVISSGRNYAEIKKYYDMIPEIRYFIGNAGSVVTDMRSGETIYGCAFGLEEITAIFNTAKEFDCMPLVHAGNEAFLNHAFRKAGKPYHAECYDRLFDEAANWIDDIEAIAKSRNDVYKTDIFFKTPEDLQAAINALQGQNIKMTTPTDSNVEIAPGTCTKGSALKELCSYLGITLEECAACGDSRNDTDMIRVAGLGIAMGNAVDEVKAVADVIVADCDHEGAAEALEKYIL